MASILERKPLTTAVSSCFHCGDVCTSATIKSKDKVFCCEGCKMVYEILNENSLCEYYDLEKNPGITQKFKVREGKFAVLEDEKIKKEFIFFSEGNSYHTQFYLPQMHCSSCVWLLENLGRLDKGITKSQVNFLKKTVSVVFDAEKTSLRKVAELLARIGYEPHISLSNATKKPKLKHNRTAIIKIGLAGFCFGNIMLLSFPEYFKIQAAGETSLYKLFSYLNLVLSLPVFFYSASEFFISAYKGFRERFLNIDAPIALAVLITFGRSVYEIISQTGAGYLDSMSGIVFFMLIGRYFQNKTYDSLSFDRDFTAYFPLGITVLKEDGSEQQVPVSNIKVGDRIKIYNEEIIPADAILFLGKANVDYSFVTGESAPIEKTIGEIIYAGGKQIGGALELEVIKEVSHSYLTQLWNNEAFKENAEEKKTSFVHALSRYFTYVLFSIAIGAAIYWYFHDSSKIADAITSVLIVACPCALLLSATFTNGNMLSMLSKTGLHIKNANALERMKDIDTIVFDKTGTITRQNESNVNYQGKTISSEQKEYLGYLFRQSNHPLSRLIAVEFPVQQKRIIHSFKEEKGKGLEATIDGHLIKAGSLEYVDVKNIKEDTEHGSRVYLLIDNEFYGYFTVKSKYRDGLETLINSLKQKFTLLVLSGDNNSEKERLETYFGTETNMLFQQKPEDKLQFIKKLQTQGKKVMMIGDGLNDAGALAQSDVGIAVSDNTNNFSPACDVILSGEKFQIFHQLINYARAQKGIILGSFIISILYNIIGLYYAVQGDLEPVIAAILMPVSSVSIVLFTVGVSSILALKIKRHDMRQFSA